MYTSHFLKAWLPCASSQLTRNFLFTEEKLHGFDYVKINYVLFKRERHSRAVVHSCSSRCSQMFFKIGALKIFAIFTGKHLWQSLFLIKFKDLQACNSIKKRLQHRCFPVNIAKFLRTAFSQNTSDGCFYSCSKFANFT